MRRTRLEKAINSIHFKVPRFYKCCVECGDDVKNEGMYYTTDYQGFKDWVCMDCFGNHADYIENNPSKFGEIDVTPMREEEAALAKVNEAMRIFFNKEEKE